MPFRLENASATSQSFVDVMLSAGKWRCALVYIDDMEIVSNTPEKHAKQAGIASQLLKDTGVVFNVLKICSLYE